MYWIRFGTLKYVALFGKMHIKRIWSLERHVVWRCLTIAVVDRVEITDHMLLVLAIIPIGAPLAKQTTKSYHSLLTLKRPSQYRLNTFGRRGIAGEEIENEHTTISGHDIRCFWYADAAIFSYLEGKHIHILPE